MLILFGVKTKKISNEIETKENCKICNEGNFFLTFYQSYIHFFWIPSIPLKKYPLMYCKKCSKCICCSGLLGSEQWIYKT